jgi:putative transcriptional regulator
MVSYPHFAVPNLFLRNGYRVHASPYGDTYEYDCEDALEECVRSVLVQLPVRLNGPQLRFLRRGLGMTQEALGEMFERDAQTVARIEKDRGPVPVYVDLTVRSLFLDGSAPHTPISALVSSVFERPQELATRVVLSYLGSGRWIHTFESSIPRLEAASSESGNVELIAGSGEFTEVDPAFASSLKFRLANAVIQTTHALKRSKVIGNESFFPSEPFDPSTLRELSGEVESKLFAFRETTSDYANRQ